ncbi:MAG: LemA family protein [Chlamydiia bacterium]|nr:LemA family protein [Chlamydiia bacterium]
MWMMPTISALFSIFLLVMMGITRKLFRLKNDVLASWKEINHQLNRRYGLILDLTEMAKYFLRHEQETLTLLAELAESAKTECEKIISYGGPTTKQNMLMTLTEHQRVLNEVFLQVTDALTSDSLLQSKDKIQDILEEIAAASNRMEFVAQGYNEAVEHYNKTQKSFFGRFLASAFGHTLTEPFIKNL